MRRAALFLDRDGVINEEVGYLVRREDVRFVPGLVSLCRTAQELGFVLVVVTNQSGIARGYYTAAAFEELMQWMRNELGRDGVRIEAVYHCPYHPEHGVGEYRREHEDRKPSPGMLRRAAADLDLDLDRSLMVGDRCSDVAAANNGGVRQAFLLAGTERTACPGRYLPMATLAELEAWLLADAATTRSEDAWLVTEPNEAFMGDVAVGPNTLRHARESDLYSDEAPPHLI